MRGKYRNPFATLTEMVGEIKAIKVMRFYKDHTFKETCAAFDLEPTHKLRKVLSELHPKSDKGGARKGAGRPGKG